MRRWQVIFAAALHDKQDGVGFLKLVPIQSYIASTIPILQTWKRPVNAMMRFGPVQYLWPFLNIYSTFSDLRTADVNSRPTLYMLFYTVRTCSAKGHILRFYRYRHILWPIVYSVVRMMFMLWDLQI